MEGVGRQGRGEAKAWADTSSWVVPAVRHPLPPSRKFSISLLTLSPSLVQLPSPQSRQTAPVTAAHSSSAPSFGSRTEDISSDGGHFRSRRDAIRNPPRPSLSRSSQHNSKGHLFWGQTVGQPAASTDRRSVPQPWFPAWDREVGVSHLCHRAELWCSSISSHPHTSFSLA